MSESRRKTVCVFGAYDAAEGTAGYATAEQVGLTLARLGFDVANGGYTGTMEASARGAKAGGARTVGVVCSIWTASANRYIDEVVVAAGLPERVGRLTALGTGGYVVLPGANGTLAEFAAVWEGKCVGLLDGRPLVCVGEFWRPVVELIRSARPDAASLVETVRDAAELGGIFRPG